MMTSNSSPRLARFYRFFEMHGTERLNGLDESYFIDFDESEKKEAWNFLVKSGLSEETINGLFILDRARAIEVIKDAITSPIEVSPYPAEQKAIESARLLMLKLLNNVTPQEEYIEAMCKFAISGFEDVRALFAQYLPAQGTTPSAVEALRNMVFTEVDRTALTSAITKLMLIHGMDFDRHDPLYKSIYVSLNSDDPREKRVAMSKLEKIQSPTYL